jgi:hypothetical protein
MDVAIKTKRELDRNRGLSDHNAKNKCRSIDSTIVILNLASTWNFLSPDYSSTKRVQGYYTGNVF